MKTVRNIKELKLKNTAVTIGKFDGVHLGHDALLSQLSKDEKTKVIFTFDAKKGTPLENDERITAEEQKLELLKKYGPDYIVVYNFGKREAALSPKRFVRQILIRRLGMKRIYAGTDFRFGRKGKGDIAELKRLGNKYGFEVVVIEKLRYGDTDISSTRIRKEISTGHLDEAAAMLGRKI